LQVFLTSTFLASLEMLESVNPQRAALGHIDRFDEPVRIYGIESQAWLRSSWIVLPPREPSRLGSLVSTREKPTWFTGSSSQPFRADAPLSANLCRYIEGWLTGSGTGQGSRGTRASR
jgi:hypothetical protein